MGAYICLSEYMQAEESKLHQQPLPVFSRISCVDCPPVRPIPAFPLPLWLFAPCPTPCAYSAGLRGARALEPSRRPVLRSCPAHRY